MKNFPVDSRFVIKRRKTPFFRKPESSSVKVDQWPIGERVILWDLSWVLDKQPLCSRRGVFPAVFGGLTTELKSRISESLLLTDKQMKLEFWHEAFSLAKGSDAKRLGPSFLLHCTAQFSVQHLPDFPAFFSGKNRSSKEKSCRFNSSPRSPSSPRSNSSPRSGSVALGLEWLILVPRCHGYSGSQVEGQHGQHRAKSRTPDL